MRKSALFNEDALRPLRQRKASSKTKNPALPKLLPTDVRTEADLPSAFSEIATEGLVARIHELEDRLNQQAALLADRCAELDAMKAGSATITALQDRLHELNGLLRDKETALSEIELTVQAELREAHEQIKMQKELLNSRETELDQLRGLLQGKTAVGFLDQDSIDRVSAETARLIAEQREAKLALAKMEIEEWYTIRRKNSWNRLFARMRSWFEKTPRGSEKRQHQHPVT
ncbi:MAG TPA: hypothetical protein VMT22_11150 [Terriglobales bacterium]|nr:hypothetical protein [Terriglobales bacterium]